MAFVCFALSEIFSYLAIGYLRKRPATSTLFYTAPTVGLDEYQKYLGERDPVLGWPTRPRIGTSMYDEEGARPSPAFPSFGPACVSLYGDSFTYANDVSNAEAWGNLLASRLGCRVANFGVGGYGTDQAYLRFENNRQDNAPITLLGILPHDLRRNLAQNVYFIFGTYPLGFKPRFVLKHRRLTLVPLPSIPAHSLDAYLLHPEKFLPYESFLPNTRLGPAQVSFPFTLSLLRAAFHPPVINKLRGRPGWMTYVEPNDPSGGLALGNAILEAFDKECGMRRKLCAVIFFPTPSEVSYYREHKRSALENLIEKTQTLGMPYLSLVAEMTPRLRGARFCELLISAENCAGHYNPDGNRMIADIVYDFFTKEDSPFAERLKHFNH